jgi:hypothetical protein
MRSANHTTAANSALRKRAGPSFRVVATLAVLALPLQACSMTGKAIDETAVSAIAIAETNGAISPDPFVKPDDAVGGDRDRMLDEDTIRNAVTSAKLSGGTSETVTWANESTGSTGTISDIRQRVVSGQTCRSFSATRQSYDGVSLYNGDLCLDRRTGWWTRILKPLG